MRVWKTILAILFFTVALHGEANPDSLLLQVRKEMRQSIDQWSERGMQQARAKFERLMSLSDKKWLVHYYIAYTDYNLCFNYQVQEKNDEAQKILDDAIEHLEQSIEMNSQFSESFALLSSCFGIKIGFSPLKAMYLGPRSGVALQKAKELDPENPRVNLIAGINYFHTPSLFGGGLENSQKALEKSVVTFKTYQIQSPLYPNWGQASSYIWLGKIAMEKEKWEEAEVNFNKALEIKPEHGYVKYTLLPELAQKRQSATAKSAEEKK